MNWNAITIKKFIQVHQVQNTSFDELDKLVKIAAIVLGKTEQDIENMPADLFKEVVDEIKFIWTTTPSDKLFKEIEVDGKKYKGTFEFNKLTAGQFIDLSHFLNEHVDKLESIHKVLAVMYYNGKYDGDEVLKFADKIYNQVTMDKAYPLFVFFCRVIMCFVRVMPDYLERKLKGMDLTHMQGSTKDMVGT